MIHGGGGAGDLSIKFITLNEMYLNFLRSAISQNEVAYQFILHDWSCCIHQADTFVTPVFTHQTGTLIFLRSVGFSTPRPEDCAVNSLNYLIMFFRLWHSPCWVYCWFWWTIACAAVSISSFKAVCWNPLVQLFVYISTSGNNRACESYY